MLTQTRALFWDAYRELNAKKLFWIALIISNIVVAAFALVGINSKGITLLWFEFPSIFHSSFIAPASFYKFLFSWLGVGYWLNWFALILALVSTAGMIPEFVTGGSVDLYLSKPISRLRLFLTKYLTALVFVAVQVTFFALACFVLIGIKSHSWDLRMFLAVPVSLLVFSYLFCICAFLGLTTRSTVAALLLTILFWLFIFGLDMSTYVLLKNKLAGNIETQAYQNQLSYNDKVLAMINERIAKGEAGAQAQLQAAQTDRRTLEEKKSKSDPRRQAIASAYSVFEHIQSLLPKTGQTSSLLARWLSIDTNGIDEEKAEMRQQKRAARGGWLSGFSDRTEVNMDDPEVVREMGEITDARSGFKIIGSSLLFEAIVLGISCWIFARRDF